MPAKPGWGGRHWAFSALGCPVGPPQPQPGLSVDLSVFLFPQVHAAPQELWPDRLIPGEKGEWLSLAGSAGH